MSSSKRVKLALSKALSKCPNYRCPSNVNKRSHNYPLVNENNSFQHTIVCNVCSDQWIICLPCKKRFLLTKKKDARHHFMSEHNIEYIDYGITTESDDVTDSFTSDFMVTNEPNFQTLETDNDLNMFSPTNPPSTTTANFNTTSHLYFNDCFKNTSTAVAGMVSRAYAQTFQPSIHGVTSTEALFHLKSTQFLSRLSGHMHNEFIEILQLAQKANSFQCTRIPKSGLEIDKFYLKNKYSLMEQLPLPSMSIKEDHAYVSLISIIDHFLAFGNVPDLAFCTPMEKSHRSITNCEFARKLYSDVKSSVPMNTNVMMLYLTLWSDDFEATSLRKNVHSTWIKTVTISPPHNETTSTKYNYILAIGRKNMDHDIVNDQINKELDELGKVSYRYYGKMKKNVPVAVKVLAMSADRPERSTMNHILNHAGLSSRRWRYSAYINQQTLPACNACTSSRITRIKNSNFKLVQDRCRFCCNWNYMSKSLKICTPPSDHYPKTQHNLSPAPPAHREVINCTQIKPVELTYDWIKQGCRFCFCNVFFKTWNIQTALTYMTSLGVNHEFARKQVIDVANDLRVREIDETNLYDYLKFPPMWNGPFTMEQNIDTPMHLLFQGIVKSIFEITFEWLKLHGKKTAFCKYIDTTLQSVKDLQCSFCRTEVLQTGKETSTSGWIAEHYLGASRILTQLCSSIRLFIKGEFSQDIDAYEFMVQTCLCFIARLMSNTEVSVHEVDDYIKLFLTSVHNFEVRTYVQDGNHDFSWYTKGNFLSLLNLPDQIQKFGHIRNYWEGSRERYIQLVKPFMKNNRNTSSYLKTQLKNVLSVTILKQIVSDLQTHGETQKQRSSRYNDVRRYRSLNEIIDALEHKEAIQCIQVMDSSGNKQVCTVTGRTSPFTLHTLSCDDSKGFNSCGLYYCPISINLDASFMICQTVEDLQSVIKSCIICVSHLEKRSYIMLTDDWLYRFENGEFYLPSFANVISNQF